MQSLRKARPCCETLFWKQCGSGNTNLIDWITSRARFKRLSRSNSTSDDLAKVVVHGPRLRVSKERLVPVEAYRHVAHADDGPYTLHRRLSPMRLPPPKSSSRVPASLRRMRLRLKPLQRNLGLIFPLR